MIVYSCNLPNQPGRQVLLPSSLCVPCKETEAQSGLRHTLNVGHGTCRRPQLISIGSIWSDQILQLFMMCHEPSFPPWRVLGTLTSQLGAGTFREAWSWGAPQGLAPSAHGYCLGLAWPPLLLLLWACLRQTGCWDTGFASQVRCMGAKWDAGSSLSHRACPHLFDSASNIAHKIIHLWSFQILLFHHLFLQFPN